MIIMPLVVNHIQTVTGQLHWLVYTYIFILKLFSVFIKELQCNV